ncbi:MAG: proline--tRNA ligase [Patescibacteria group bacterium]
MSSKAITTQEKDYSQWYLDVVDAADLAENSSVRGCMVIKPYGYALWENMQRVLDAKFKETGAVNAYFPIFIPKSFFEREAEHVEGFAKECAVVTHHRLELDAKTGKLAPAGPLEEPLVVRPTSETIIYDTYSRWIESYRDLPLLINQWANVVRWEMRTRLFLRSMEFLWQEGHTAHATKEEADERTRQMVDVYKDFFENYLAIPVISGRKTESEKFAGAEYTLCIEAMMGDGKALQAGTSHMLGQNFAKAFNVGFLDEKGQRQLVWQTSWGVSTRMIGGLIMAHGDNKGMIMPPQIAPIQVIIVAIFTDSEEEKLTVAKANGLAKELKQSGVSVQVDGRDERPGVKFYDWEKKGVPLRIEIGPKDVEKNQAVLVRRDNGEKSQVASVKISQSVTDLLVDIQKSLYEKALKFQKANTKKIDTLVELEKHFSQHEGFVLAHWCGDDACAEEIKVKTKATIRCIPFDQQKDAGKCPVCGKSSQGRVIFAKAY